MRENAEAVCLIKPQFEAGKENVGKKGVVRDSGVHIDVINKIVSISLNEGFSVLGIDFSPIKGPEGNIEYLIHLKKDNCATNNEEISVEDLVAMSHTILKQ